MIATNDPNLTATNDVSVWGQLIPAKEVGGDLYNAFIRDGKLFFCIGDVSGKGVPSALIMAVTQALFRNIATRENNPAHIMAQLNETACRNNKSNYFATLFVGVLDLPSGHLRFCNAGHEVPILLTQSGGKVECRMLEVEPHLPIGLFDDFRYEMQEIVMQKDASLFLYTDGLTEGRSPKNEPFGMERIMQALADGHTVDAQPLVENMVRRYSDFVGTAPQRDDLTLLALHYSPVEENCLLDEELVLQNDISQVTQLGAMIKETAQRLNIPKSLAYQLRLAMEEAVVNIIDYAYPAGTSGDIRVRETFNGQRLKFVITDTGVAFNPTEASIADTSLSAEDRPVGGLGILLVRKLMDAINYERIDGKNILTLTKTINVKQ
jgi:sigma-B regulation protein RsbU (phosphoserine phosphatase)